MAVEYQLLILMVAAYLIGSIPFGLVVGLTKGVDPRLWGSGNIGATNVGRLLGGRWFAVVFTLDMLKGLLPMLTAGWVLHRHDGLDIGEGHYLLWMGVGCATIIGHMFSIFLGFKGGKGVATSAGVMLGLWPYYTLPGLVGTVLFLIIFKWTRYVSLASVAGIGAFPLLYIAIGEAMGWPVFGAQLPLLIFAVAMAVLITWKHRTNLARLRAGTEHRIVKKSGSPDLREPRTQ